jgi:putative CRISPR-associated protein (TIGR02619 family)
MAGISPDLLSRLKQALATCAEFFSDHALRIVFTDQRISLYYNDIPQADNSNQRIDFLIDFLRNCNQDSKNGLVEFLRVLAGRYNGDDREHLLVELASKLELELGKPASRQNDSSKKAEVSVQPTIEQVTPIQVSDNEESIIVRKPSVIVSTVGISILQNMSPFKLTKLGAEWISDAKAIKDELDNVLLKQEDHGRAAVARLVNWLEKLEPYHNVLDFPLIPAEISALNAINVTEDDVLYFLAGVSEEAIADSGEVCGKALVEYYQKQLPRANVTFIPVHGSIIRNKKLVGEWEMLRELDRVVSEEKDRNPNVPVIMNLTGGYRLNGIYASLVGLAYGCEIYYIHEDMSTSVGLPVIDEKVLNLPTTKNVAEFQNLPDKYKKFYSYRESSKQYVRINLVNIVNAFPKSVGPN